MTSSPTAGPRAARPRHPPRDRRATTGAPRDALPPPREPPCSTQSSRASPRSRNVTLVIIPRTDEQREHYATLGLDNVVVPEQAIDGLSLIAAADFVIGAGGTMNREAVALGTPAYTMFAGRLGAVDERLLAEGRLRRAASADDVESQEEGPPHAAGRAPRSPALRRRDPRRGPPQAASARLWSRCYDGHAGRARVTAGRSIARVTTAGRPRERTPLRQPPPHLADRSPTPVSSRSRSTWRYLLRFDFECRGSSCTSSSGSSRRWSSCRSLVFLLFGSTTSAGATRASATSPAGVPGLARRRRRRHAGRASTSPTGCSRSSTALRNVTSMRPRTGCPGRSSSSTGCSYSASRVAPACWLAPVWERPWRRGGQERAQEGARRRRGRRRRARRTRDAAHAAHPLPPGRLRRRRREEAEPAYPQRARGRHDAHPAGAARRVRGRRGHHRHAFGGRPRDRGHRAFVQEGERAGQDAARRVRAHQGHGHDRAAA